MEKKAVHKFKMGCLIILLIIAIFLVQYFFINKSVNDEFNRFGKYTIGTTYDKTIASKANDYIYYFYYYKGEKYVGKNELKLNIKVPGGRFYTLFSTKNPNNSIIYFNKPVPDSIKIAPLEGWNKLP